MALLYCFTQVIAEYSTFITVRHAEYKDNRVCFSFFGLNVYDASLFFSVHTVIGGKEAVPYSRPYMVIVEKRTENNSKPKICHGFLVNEEFVLTAAHCKAE